MGIVIKKIIFLHSLSEVSVWIFQEYFLLVLVLEIITLRNVLGNPSSAFLIGKPKGFLDYQIQESGNDYCFLQLYRFKTLKYKQGS